MPVTHTITRTYKDQSANSVQKVETVTTDKENNLSKALAIGTNVQLNFVCTQAKLQSICFSATTAADLYTNAPSTGSPQEHIAIGAGQALIWTRGVDGVGKIPFAGDVTTIYVTNVAATVLDIRAAESA